MAKGSDKARASTTSSSVPPPRLSDALFWGSSKRKGSLPLKWLRLSLWFQYSTKPALSSEKLQAHPNCWWFSLNNSRLFCDCHPAGFVSETTLSDFDTPYSQIVTGNIHANGYGSKFNHQETAGVGPCFRLPVQAIWELPIFDPHPKKILRWSSPSQSSILGLGAWVACRF